MDGLPMFPARGVATGYAGLLPGATVADAAFPVYATHLP